MQLFCSICFAPHWQREEENGRGRRKEKGNGNGKRGRWERKRWSERDLEGNQQVEEEADVLVPCSYSCLCCECAQKKWAMGEGTEVKKRGHNTPATCHKPGNLDCRYHTSFIYYPNSSSQAYWASQGLVYICILNGRVCEFDVELRDEGCGLD